MWNFWGFGFIDICWYLTFCGCRESKSMILSWQKELYNYYTIMRPFMTRICVDGPKLSHCPAKKVAQTTAWSWTLQRKSTACQKLRLQQSIGILVLLIYDKWYIYILLNWFIVFLLIVHGCSLWLGVAFFILLNYFFFSFSSFIAWLKLFK